MKSFPDSDESATPGRMQKPMLRKTARSKRLRDSKRPGVQSAVVHNTIRSRIEKPSRLKSRDQLRHTTSHISGGIIRVLLTNRLGIRQEILCSACGTIGQLKILVAVQLGLRPETILLKRQGQRPLKDFLTLQEYEIGSGSSLDLEMDTGA